MSGHSKWSTIKHKKAKVDAQRGKIFTKLIKEISVAARSGGGDIDSNARLRTAVNAARSANMPQDNVKRAIQKGTGELPGTRYDEGSFEGYGPGGAAVYVEILTDNNNRTTAEIRHMFSKCNGNLGESGCVAWLFTKKGLITVDKNNADADTVMMTAIDGGADDVTEDGDTIEVFTQPNDLEAVKKALDDAGIQTEVCEVSLIPSTTVDLGLKDANNMLKLMEGLEDHEDVQTVASNFDISEEVMEQLTQL